MISGVQLAVSSSNSGGAWDTIWQVSALTTVKPFVQAHLIHNCARSIIGYTEGRLVWIKDRTDSTMHYCAKRILRPLRVGPAEIHVCLSVCLLTILCQIATGQQGGDRAVAPWCFERNDQKFSKITVFGPVSNTTYPSYLWIGGLKNGHFSLFLDQFQTRLTLHISGLEVSKMVTFHCFWISFKHDLPFISRD